MTAPGGRTGLSARAEADLTGWLALDLPPIATLVASFDDVRVMAGWLAWPSCVSMLATDGTDLRSADPVAVRQVLHELSPVCFDAGDRLREHARALRDWERRTVAFGAALRVFKAARGFGTTGTLNTTVKRLQSRESLIPAPGWPSDTSLAARILASRLHATGGR